MTNAQKKLQAAVIDFLCLQPFFGALTLSLPFKEDPTCDTAWTDGRNIGYNPTFIDSLSFAETQALLGHEVMHVALGHPWRRDGRDIQQWNVACDIPINATLKESGFQTRPDWLHPTPEQVGKSAEWIYARLPQPKPQPKGGKDGKGDGKSSPGQGKPVPGEVRDAPTGDDENGNPAPTEGEWKQRTAEALQQAKMAGNLPAGLSRMVEKALDKRVDVKALLLRFFTERIRADYDFCRPNVRYISQGLYLPALHSVSMGEVAILCDTSGSTSTVSLAYARSIVAQVLEEVQPAGITLYFVDTKIHGTHRMEPGDPLTWEPKGNRGTNFTSFFEEVERGDTQPVCIIGISDLAATFGNLTPSAPVLWLTDTQGGTAPFGEVIELSI